MTRRRQQERRQRRALESLSFLIWGGLIMSAESLTTTTPTAKRVIVVGKVIIDEYGKPDDEKEAVISIGGGGPQAAFGAAAALAALSGDTSDPPPKQPVVFVGPVGGEDWTESDTQAMEAILGNACEAIVLPKGVGLKTPRISLWHDDDQCIQWKALRDSFGAGGADGLWSQSPNPQDILPLIGDDEQVGCHIIAEGSKNGPGGGGDVGFLHDQEVQERLSFIGAEPVAFADETGKVPPGDAAAIVSRLNALPSLDFICPDNEIFQAIDMSFWRQHQVAIRKGPQGSVLLNETSQVEIPAATLETPDGKPVNPTGAGNSYSGAMTALLASGSLDRKEAACIAAAVGAVFCEYSHIPPWKSHVIARIRRATEEIRNNSK